MKEELILFIISTMVLSEFFKKINNKEIDIEFLSKRNENLEEEIKKIFNEDKVFEVLEFISKESKIEVHNLIKVFMKNGVLNATYLMSIMTTINHFILKNAKTGLDDILLDILSKSSKQMEKLMLDIVDEEEIHNKTIH